jgi:uncharacterized protein YkwD
MTTRPTPARAVLRVSITACAAVAFVLGLGAGAADAGPARMNAGERAVVHRVNAIRHAHGLAGLRGSQRLARAADQHSAEMMRHHYLGHASADGSPWDRRVRRYVNARSVGETVAVLSRRSRMARAVVRAWMDSAPHRATLLSPSFRRIGVARRAGHWNGRRSAFFTADLASRR